MAAYGCCNCVCACRGFPSRLIKSVSLHSSSMVSKQTDIRRRAFSSSAVILNEEKNSSEKKRDRLTVLKALSSTVEQIPNRPDYRFYDDVILNPRSLTKQKELLLAMESGSKTADYVIEKYPHLFPLREPVPAWGDSQEVDLSIEDNEDNLKFLLKTKENSKRALEMYERLKSSGDLSIDVHNEVLDFVSFHNIATTSSASVTEQVEDVTSSGSSSSSSDEENTAEIIAKEQDTAKKTKWRSDGYAETLFTELKNVANSQTYEVFILGLLQHEEYIRAFHLFQELKDMKFQGSTHFCNKLLSHVCDVRTGDKDKWDLVEEITDFMKTVNILPNNVTFIEVMAVAYTMEDHSQRLCQNILREMKKIKIEPSLGCYYYLLIAERKKPYQDIQLLYEILNDLMSGAVSFDLHHPADMMFFHSAMDLARFKRSGRLAKDLLDVVLSNGLQHMLGVRSSSFFGNYLCAVARNAPSLDDVFTEYDKIVPKVIIPRDWVYQQLFLAMRNHKNPENVPRLYKDMVSMRVPLSDKSARALYDAMDEYVPKERISEFLHVALDVKRWLKVFNVKMTAEISSTIIKLLCMGEKYEEARELIDEITSQGILPSEQAMSYLLELTLQQDDKQAALNTLKHMKNFGMALSDNVKQIIESSSLLTEKREKIEEMFRED